MGNTEEDGVGRKTESDRQKDPDGVVPLRLLLHRLPPRRVVEVPATDRKRVPVEEDV